MSAGREGRSLKGQESGTPETSSETTPRRQGRREATGHLQRSVYQEIIYHHESRCCSKGISSKGAEERHQASSDGKDREVAPGRTRSSSLPCYRKGRIHGAEPAQGMGCAEASTTSIRIPSTREGDQGICGSEALRDVRDLTGQPDGVGDRGIGPCGLGRNVARVGWFSEARCATSPIRGTQCQERRGIFGIGRATRR